MTRLVMAVILGYAAWTVLWLGGNAVFFGETASAIDVGNAFTKRMPLVGSIGLSLGCSVVAGFVSASVAPHRARPAVMTTALLLLATGIGVQAGVWTLMPVWYHVAFLLMLIPFVCTGGRLAPHR